MPSTNSFMSFAMQSLIGLAVLPAWALSTWQTLVWWDALDHDVYQPFPWSMVLAAALSCAVHLAALSVRDWPAGLATMCSLPWAGAGALCVVFFPAGIPLALMVVSHPGTDGLALLCLVAAAPGLLVGKLLEWWD